MIVLDESHESIKKDCLGSFHKVWSQCSLEIFYSSSIWLSQLWAQAVVEQQLGCPILRYHSETTDEERLHVKHGTIDLLQSNLKAICCTRGLDSVRHACGESYLYSRQQAGEPLRMVYSRPMCALCDTSLLSVFHKLQLYLGRRCALDIPSQHLTVRLPCRVPVGCP